MLLHSQKFLHLERRSGASADCPLRDSKRTRWIEGSIREKGQRLASPLSPHVDAEVDFYFLAFFFAFFFFAIVTSFSPDIGKSEICSKPIT